MGPAHCNYVSFLIKVFFLGIKNWLFSYRTPFSWKTSLNRPTPSNSLSNVSQGSLCRVAVSDEVPPPTAHRPPAESSALCFRWTGGGGGVGAVRGSGRHLSHWGPPEHRKENIPSLWHWAPFIQEAHCPSGCEGGATVPQFPLLKNSVSFWRTALCPVAPSQEALGTSFSFLIPWNLTRDYTRVFFVSCLMSLGEPLQSWVYSLLFWNVTSYVIASFLATACLASLSGIDINSALDQSLNICFITAFSLDCLSSLPGNFNHFNLRISIEFFK